MKAPDVNILFKIQPIDLATDSYPEGGVHQK